MKRKRARILVQCRYSIDREYPFPTSHSERWSEEAYREATDVDIRQEAYLTMLRIASGKQRVDYYK